jgi:hypothetical protein
VYESTKLASVLGLAIGHTGKPIDVGPITYAEQITDPRKKPVPVMQITGTVWAVDEAFRTIVEDFEPGLHEFFEIDIRCADGSKPATTYYFFNVCQRIASVDVDRSELSWNTRADGSTFASFPSYDDQLLVRGNAIAGKHIWRDDHFFWEAIFCSDEIKRALRAAKFQMLEFTRARVELKN